MANFNTASELTSLLTFQCFGTDLPREIIQDDIHALDLNPYFATSGSKVNLSGHDFSDWLSLQNLCARLSRSDNSKSDIYLDHCSLGKHGAVVVARSFTHVLFRAGNYHAQWLPLMHQNNRITLLSMINNNIGADGAAAIAKMLRVNTGLRELNLRFNNIHTDGLHYIASALFVNTALQFLCVSGNAVCGIDDNGEGEYDSSGIISLCKALHMNKKLKTLKLAENDIYDDGVRYIGDALAVNQTLTALDLHGNAIFQVLESRYAALPAIEVKERVVVCDDLVDGKGHAESSMSPPSTPQSTPISETPPSPTDTGAYVFLQSLQRNSALQYLDLSWNDIGSHSLVLLCSSLHTNKTLNYLKLEGNLITVTGAVALGELLATNHVLSTLICDRMGIGAEGMEHISAGIKSNRGLVKLSFCCNAIGCKGAHFLATSLYDNKHIKDLKLHRCDISTDGIAHLAQMLQVNTALVSLDLSSNRISDDGIFALSATVPINDTLEHLDLSIGTTQKDPEEPDLILGIFSPYPTDSPGYSSNSTISEAGADAIAFMIRNNNCLLKLDLRGHNLNHKSCFEILQAMDDRRLCVVEASYHTAQWKYDEIIASINHEAMLLSSTEPCPCLRVHVVGSSSKDRLLQQWTKLHQQRSAWSDIFGHKENQPELNNCISTYNINIGSNRYLIWSYHDTEKHLLLHQHHLVNVSMSICLVSVNSIASNGQCLSPVVVAKEILYFMQLLLTFGHSNRNIIVIFNNAAEFDQTWKGLDPKSAGVKVTMETSNHSDTSSPPPDILPSEDKALTPSEEQSDNNHTRRHFYECIHDILSQKLGYKSLPKHMLWDDDLKTIEEIIIAKQKFNEKHIQLPTLSNLILNKYLPVMLSYNIIHGKELWKQLLHEVHSITMMDVYYACQWLDQLGMLLLLELPSSNRDNFLLVLHPPWYCSSLLLPLVTNSSQCDLPFGCKESLLSCEDIDLFTSSVIGNNLLGFANISRVMETSFFGVKSSSALLIPSRVLSTKAEWLWSCGITHIPLAQTSHNSIIHLVIARRLIGSEHYRIPQLFGMVQSYVMQRCVHKISLWWNGFGVVNATSNGTICVLVEQCPIIGVIDIILWVEDGDGGDALTFLHTLERLVLDAVYACTQKSHFYPSRTHILQLPNENLASDWIRSVYIKPSCALHTLRLSPQDRHCGVCNCTEDDEESLILVVCQHLQPRLAKRHLLQGYIVSDMPNQGKALLRSVSASLEGVHIGLGGSLRSEENVGAATE